MSAAMTLQLQALDCWKAIGRGAEMEEPAIYANYYRHCDQIWIDTWSCKCNDRCPVCNREIEPYFSKDLFEEVAAVGEK